MRQGFVVVAASLILGWAIFTWMERSREPSEVPAAAADQPAEDATAATPPALDPPPAPAPRDDLGLVDLLDDLRAEYTGAEWASEYPQLASSLVAYVPWLRGTSWGSYSEWCLRSEQTVSLANGATVERVRYFFQESYPEPPDDLRFPELADGAELRLRVCRVGLVSIELRDSPDEASLLADVRSALAATYGDGTEIVSRDLPSRLSPGTRTWQEITSWTEGDLTAVVVRHEDGHPSAFGFLPSLSGPGIDRYATTPTSFEAHVMTQALAEAGLDPTTAEAMATARANPGERGSSPNARALLDVVRALVEPPIGGGAGEERRAARLLVADILLNDVAPTFEPVGPSFEPPPLVDSLVGLGAQYFYFDPAAEYRYRRSLLDSVSASPAPSRWGDLATLIGLERSCGPAQTVIETATTILERALEGPDEALIARLHYLLGDANADIVGLSSTADPDRFPQTYVDEVAEARLRAIEHFRAAIDGDLEPALEERAWHRAWDLSANMYTGIRFRCAD